MSSKFLAAVGGSRGITGPAGPQGTPGANGLSLDVFLYKFSAATSGTPAPGFLRLDSGTTPTRLVAATVDDSGRDQTVPLQVALGGKIRIQLRTNIGSYIELTSTGAPVAVVGAIEWAVTTGAVVGPAGPPLDTNEVYLTAISDASALAAAVAALQASQVVQDGLIAGNTTLVNNLATSQLAIDGAQNTAITALQTQNATQDFAIQTLNTSQAAQDVSIGILQAKTARQDVNARWTEPVEPALPNSSSVGSGALPWGNVYSFDVTATNLRANTWRNATDTAGVSLTDSAAGSVQLSGSDYTGDADRAITIGATGILSKSGASISATGNINCADVAGVNISATQALRSNDWYNLTNDASIALAPTAAGTVTLSGSDYTGTADNLLNVDATGIVRKTQATMSQAGALECKSILTQSITGNAAGPNADLEVKNQAGVGIKLVDGAAGAICLTGTNYAGAAKVGQFLRIDDSKGTLVAAAVTGGTGDVVGPAAATDERIARWDGATGKLLQDSSVWLTDGGGLTGVTGINLTSGALVQGPSAVFEAALFRGNAVLAPEQVAHLVNQSNVGVAIRAGPDAKVRFTGTEYAAKQGQYLRIDDATGTLVAAAVTGATGDVVGPAGSTDEAVARYDTSTGKLLQDSSVGISDSGRIYEVEYIAFASDNVRLAGASNNSVGPLNPGTSVANVCIGNGAAQNLTGGGTNVCIGDVAAPNVGTGNGNVFIGQLASTGMTSGNGNVFIGDNTPSSAANASNNVIVGARSKAGGDNSIALGADVETGLGVPTNQACIGNSSVVALYNQGNGTCDLGRATNPFKDLHLGGVAKLSGYTASAGKLFTVNPSGDLVALNLVGPGTLRVDAAGVVSVLLDPISFPPLVTPNNLTSFTSDLNFIVSESSSWQNPPPLIYEAWRLFDATSVNGVWNSIQNSYDGSGNPTGTDIFNGVSGSWFKVSLDQVRQFNQYQFDTGAIGPRNPVDFRLWASTDNINWAVIHQVTGHTTIAGWNTFDIGTQQYRYLLFQVTKITPGAATPSAEFFEFRFVNV